MTKKTLFVPTEEEAKAAVEAGMSTEVKAGQVWRSNDGGSLFMVHEVDASQTIARGACPDGKRPREMQVARLLKSGRNGYRLVEDAP